MIPTGYMTFTFIANHHRFWTSIGRREDDSLCRNHRSLAMAMVIKKGTKGTTVISSPRGALRDHGRDTPVRAIFGCGLISRASGEESRERKIMPNNGEVGLEGEEIKERPKSRTISFRQTGCITGQTSHRNHKPPVTIITAGSLINHHRPIYHNYYNHSYHH
ncbi:hypothetical protein Acr_03g0018110 [Actinidia rufa]|uniref:Uncharacterized protein n=1 Tax=Actinidia rufa TaxID=165716 RepID=A0A7J0EHB9_9ERIC|nr:hypothetical protein Acr_03g0018110 [Actinidia rufa]